MNINLALVLVVLTAVSGAVVAINRLVWQKRKQRLSPALATVVEYSQSFFPVLLLVLVIRSFIFEPFRIPSGSMEPTLLRGDFIFVKKYSYGLRLPVLESKFLETGEPERGDVVVFRLPSDPNVNYIKRVIGLPGDTIVYRDHQLTINGEPVELEHDDEPQVFVETLGEREHRIQITAPGSRQGENVYVVPDDHYFVMGDNRDNSKDSRFINAIPETHLVGEAVRIWMHMDGLGWPRWERIGDKIQ